MNSSSFILDSSFRHISEPPETSVSDYILRRLTECATNNSLKYSPRITNPVTGESHKYSDFPSLSRNIANTLHHKYGFHKGDTLVYSAHDGSNLHVFLLGVWRAGGIIRSSYPEDTKGELRDRIQESNARWILCDQVHAIDCLKISQEFAWKIRVIVFGPIEVEGCISASELLLKNDSVNEDDENYEPSNFANEIALILPTSGTTGNSKGAVYTHAIVIKTLALLESLPFNDDPTTPTLFMGKQTHVSGCLIALARITAGHDLLMLNQINTATIVQVVREYKPRSIFLFPKYLTELVEDQARNSFLYDLGCVQFVATAGVIVSPDLVETAKKLPNLKAFIMCYGMTECGLLTTNVEWISNDCTNNNICTKPINDFPAFSCGKLVPGTSLMVKDPTNSDINAPLHSLSPGQLGELYFKSSIAFRSYFNKPKETAETLIHDGWIRTGDLGYYDKNGFVFVTDRVKETFKYFNNHISPTEIEQVILRHEFVQEVCVVGIPDPNGGDMIPRAFVVLKNDARARRNGLDGVAGEIKTFTNDLLPTYKQLQGGLFIIQALPYGKTGKLCRKELQNFSLN